MFVLTCPHCQAEVKTRVARRGATVKCMACQQTHVLDDGNTREEPDADAKAPEWAATDREESHDTKAAMAAIHEMAQELDEPEPQVDIYANHGRFSAETLRKWAWLVFAVALLVAVIAGALWLLKSPPAAKPPVRQTVHEPGTAPAVEN